MTSRRWSACVSEQGRFAIVLLATALVARLSVVAFFDPFLWVDGSDAPYYLREGWRLLHGQLPWWPPVAPLYAQWLALSWLPYYSSPFPTDTTMIPVGLLAGVRVWQVAASVVMVAALACLAWRLCGRRRAPVVVVIGLGLGPAFVLEPFRVLTETMALMWLGLALLWWAAPGRTAARAALTGLAVGLAALTRPVMFGLPWVLALHDWGVTRRAPVGARHHGALLLAVCLVVVMPWVVTLRMTTGHWLPHGFGANLWIGAVGDGRWMGTSTMDERRREFEGGPDDYLGEVSRVVQERPLAWLATRASNLGAALVQPHFAQELGTRSVRAVVLAWWHGDTTPGELAQAVGDRAGLTKLMLYAWHWTALVLGLGGLCVVRSRERYAVQGLALVAAYFLAVHLLLSASPRYLLPTQLPLWIGVALLVARSGRTPAPGVSAAAPTS